MAHLARGLERPRVVAVSEHGSRAPPQLVEHLRDPDREPLHPARERLRVGGLADQV
jgi:hypothetical protein